FEIVNEMGQTQRGDAAELLGLRTFEIDAAGTDGVIAREQTLRSHPVERRLAKIDTRRVEMAVLGLMTDNGHHTAFVAAAAKKGRKTRSPRRVRDTLTVNVALNGLPAELAVPQR